MNGKFFWVLLTLIFILIGHLAYVLFIPGYKMESKLESGFEAHGTPSFVTLSEKQTIELFPAEDPAMLHAVCPFDVSKGAINITIAPFDHYWSLSIYSQKGDSYYSINDRQSVDTKLSIHIRQVIQKTTDQEDIQPKLVPDLTIIDAPSPKGWAVLRFHVHNDSARTAIAERAKSFLCKRDDK